MLRRSGAIAAALAATPVRLQFAGARGGGGSGDINSAGSSSGKGERRKGRQGFEAVDDTVEGFFGALKKRLADFELNKDRRLDAEAQADEAARRRATSGNDKDDATTDAAAAARGESSERSGRPLRISENPNACPRSVLFSPGSKPRAMKKILDLPADCFILDLEDSVGPSQKREAREHIREFVQFLEEERKYAEEEEMPPAGGTSTSSPRLHKRLVVRINSPDFDPTNAMLDLELVGLLGHIIEGVAIPKVTTRTFGLIKDYVHPDHQLWAFFESPLSILQAPEICLQRHYRYAVMGFNDLANELQLPVSATSGDRLPGGARSFLARDLTVAHTAVAQHLSRLPLLHSAMQVLLAARAADMHVLDAVFNDPTDAAGFRQDLLTCRAMGYNGKTLIHPSQIAPTNAAFAPTPAEVEWASRIKQAVASAHGGVATVDGKMVEDLHVRQANRMLALNRTTESERAEQQQQQQPHESQEGGDSVRDASKDERRDDMVRKPPSRQGQSRD